MTREYRRAEVSLDSVFEAVRSLRARDSRTIVVMQWPENEPLPADWAAAEQDVGRRRMTDVRRRRMMPPPMRDARVAAWGRREGELSLVIGSGIGDKDTSNGDDVWSGIDGALLTAARRSGRAGWWGQVVVLTSCSGWAPEGGAAALAEPWLTLVDGPMPSDRALRDALSETVLKSTPTMQPALGYWRAAAAEKARAETLDED